MTSLVRSLPLMALLAATLLAVAGQSAPAQTVEDELQRLKRELSDLQRQVYSGATPPNAASGAATGGGAAGSMAPTQAARIQLQVDQLEQQLADLTGRIEDMTFQIQTVTGRVDKLVADVDLRLRNLEQGGGGPKVGSAAPAPGTGMQGMSAMPEQGGAMAAPAPGASMAQTAPQTPAHAGTIGSISESDLSRFKQQEAAGAAAPASTAEAAASGAVSGGAAPSGAAPSGAAQTAALPGGTPQEQYDYAFGLLRQANYAGAEQAFTAFLAQHPDHSLAGNAKYWLGETYYVRGDYQQAAVTFAEGYKAYPKSSKAPDNLLKLGMSLASLGSTKDACDTYSALLDRYADAPATILSRAQRESKRLSCK